MDSCIIVGAGPGVGLALARRFGRSGYRIGLIARSGENLRAQAQELMADGISATWATADAGNAAELENALRQLLRECGGCSVLIYNAAVLRPGEPLAISREDVASEFSVNLLGALQAAQIVAPEMIEKGRGAILFTGGGLALEPFPEWSSLALGKAALRSLAISLFKALAPKGIHVSVIAICGIVERGGALDPDKIAEEYFRVATAPRGVEDREVIIQPAGSDPLYNDPDGIHAATTLLPAHASKQ